MFSSKGDANICFINLCVDYGQRQEEGKSENKYFYYEQQKSSTLFEEL